MLPLIETCYGHRPYQTHFHPSSHLILTKPFTGLPRWLSSKESTYNARDVSLIPGSGRSPGEGNGNPLQYSCLRTPWTEEPGGLQSKGSQKRQTQLGEEITIAKPLDAISAPHFTLRGRGSRCHEYEEL